MSCRRLYRSAFSLCLLASLGACSGTEQPADEIEVAPFKRAFMGLVPGFHMVSRPAATAPWQQQLPIEGFAFKWGTSARLRVEMRMVANPPADGPDRTYHLVQLLSTTPVVPCTQFDLYFRGETARVLIEGEPGSPSLKGEKGLVCPDAVVCAELDRRRRSAADVETFVVTVRHPARAVDPLEVVAVADYRP